MTRIADNAITRGMRGTFANTLVFRTFRGRTFVSAPARKPDKKKETEAQRSTRTNFKEAVAWAQHVLEDPAKKEYYRKRAKALKLPNAYTAAVTDFLRKPEVTQVPKYKGVSCMISKPGFDLVDVTATASTGASASPAITIKKRPNFWLLIVEKPDVSQSYEINYTVTDSFGRGHQMDMRV